MTNPNTKSNWPLQPTVPNTAPDGYHTPVRPDPTPVETPITSGQAESRRQDFYELLLRQVLQALTGFFLPGLGSAFSQLASWASHIPVLGDIVNALAGIPGTLTDLAHWALNLLNGFSPLNAFNLFGIFNPIHIGTVVGGAVGLKNNNNLVSEPAFRDAITLVAGQGWTWDGTTGNHNQGSVKVVADGDQNELVSNEIPVVPDETLNFAVWVKWTGLSYSGTTTPISFGITGYDLDSLTKVSTELDSIDLASFTSPAAASSPTWQQLSGTYTVPGLGEGAIPETIRMRFKIAQGVTAGNVWFDEPTAMKGSTVSDSVVPGVGTTTDNIVNGLENLSGSAWDHASAKLALKGQNDATVSLSTRVNYLESLLTTGIQATDLFERVNTANLGPDWDEAYTGGGGGTWATRNGHDANWTDSGNSSRTVICRFIAPGLTISNTDTQKIVGVLGSKAQHKYSSNGTNILIGRYSTDKMNGIYGFFRADGRISISTLIAGSFTELDFVQLDTGPSSGSSIVLLCGTPTAETPAVTRLFRAMINGQMVLECTDASSNFGAGYRGWGHGGIASGYSQAVVWPPPFFDNGQAGPGSLNSWSGIDN